MTPSNRLERVIAINPARISNAIPTTAVGTLTPTSFLELDTAELRAIGFSRQKAGYVRGLSRSILQGDINLEGLETLDDESARAELMKIKGIGSWTAEIYLLMALRRPDAKINMKAVPLHMA